MLIKNKISTIINVLGLSLGIASSLILFVVIKFELSFDRFHSNYANIYRIANISHDPNGDSYDPGIYYPMALAVRDNMPDIGPVAMLKFVGNSTISITKNGEPELFKESGSTPACIELHCGNCIKWYTFGRVRFDA